MRRVVSHRRKMIAILSALSVPDTEGEFSMTIDKNNTLSFKLIHAHAVDLIVRMINPGLIKSKL